jgi:hypothetical protein
MRAMPRIRAMLSRAGMNTDVMEGDIQEENEV